MEPLLILAGLLLLLALAALWLGARRRREAGLPEGRVVAADMGRWKRLERPLYDHKTGLTGRPDYLVEQDGALIPVEVKSGWAPAAPREGHLFQLAAYCLLVERTQGRRPPYGLLHYRNRTFAIDYTPTLESELLALLEEIHAQQRRSDVPRSHEEPVRCARCGFRSTCDQKL